MKESNHSTLSILINGLIYLTLTIASIFPMEGIAAKEIFPFGCRPVGFLFKYHVLMLNPYAYGESQSLYFIHNKSPKLVKFFQMRNSNEPYIMHINNEIKANQWAAFATDEKQVKFICTIPGKETKYGEIVDCSKVLELCEYTNVKFSINNHGNYWAVTSDPINVVIQKTIEQGVLLRW